MAKEKIALAKQLHSRQIKRPPMAIYQTLGYLWKLLFFQKLGVKVTYKQDPRKCKGACIVISNHASRMDYIYVGIPLLPHRYNFVAGYNEFFRSHLAGVFKLLQVIPKKNFAPDIYTIKEITRVIKKGGKIVLFPEGMNSINGYNQPIALGSAKLFKHLGVPVYYSVIKGGYLTCPKYNLEAERPGKIEVVFDKLFSPEDLKTLTVDEIDSKINKALLQDDYAWNKEKQISFKCKGNLTEHMEDLIYKCPACGAEREMLGLGMTLKCKKCDFSVSFDDKYNMTPSKQIDNMPATPRAWHDWQRKEVYMEIQNPSFVFSDKVKLGMLKEFDNLKDQKTSEIVGEGILSISREGLKYEGTKNGQPYTFKLETSEVPTYGMCTDVTRFYTFVDGEFCEFYPENSNVAKWFLVTEELHRLNGGKWKNYNEFDYSIE